MLPAVHTVAERLGKTWGALRAVFANRDLRRLQLAAMGSVVGNWAYLVALTIYAYDAGGPAAVGLVMFLRLIPAAIASPFTSMVGDRFNRKVVLVVVDLGRAGFMMLVAGLIWMDADPLLVYVTLAVSGVMSTAYRPAHSALLPALAKSPDELAASNVATSAITSVGAIVGPALGAAILALTSTEVVFVVNAATFVWSAALVLGVHAPAQAGTLVRGRSPFGREALAGFGAVAGNRDMLVISILVGAQALIGGMLNVFVAVLALQVLDTGTQGVGTINAAIGVGGIVGGAVALALVQRQRLGEDYAIGLFLFSIPFAIAAVVQEPALVVVSFALLGIGNTIVDVSSFTLMQLIVPDDVLARAFGTLQSVILLALGLGAIVAPFLVDQLGSETALLVAGLSLPVLAVLAWPRLRSIDRRVRMPVQQLELLGRSPIFAPLSAQTLEPLATLLSSVSASPGEAVISAL
jgi:MFS family permease